jgi:glycerol-3-phosphate dehydrogenase
VKIAAPALPSPISAISPSSARQEAYPAEPGVVAPSADGIAALCPATRAFLRDPVTAEDIARLLALHSDGSRTPHVSLDAPAGAAPLLTVYGGAMMSYRVERALAAIADCFAAGSTWTHTAPLPEGDFAWDGIEALVARTRARWHGSPNGDNCRDWIYLAPTPPWSNAAPIARAA